jgi:hypothetical protein
MPLSRKLFALVCTVGAAGLVGCMHATPESTPAAPTTMPTTAPTTMEAAPVVMTPLPGAPAAKDMTHSITADQPYFTSAPGAGVAPAGTLKAGSKVLVMVPDVPYSQVVTDMGIHAWTATEGLKPLGK